MIWFLCLKLTHFSLFKRKFGQSNFSLFQATDITTSRTIKVLLFAIIPLFLLVNGSLASTNYWSRANTGFMPTDAWRAATDQSGRHIFIGRLDSSEKYIIRIIIIFKYATII